MKKTNTIRTIETSTIIKVFYALLFFFTPLMADDFSSTVRVHRQSGASFSGTVIEVENGKTLAQEFNVEVREKFKNDPCTKSVHVF